MSPTTLSPAPAEGHTSSDRAPGRRAIRWALSGALAMALAAGGGIAAAATGWGGWWGHGAAGADQGRPAVTGTVATAPTGDASTLTVTRGDDGTWTVTLTASTTYSERGVASPTYLNVKVGEEVAVYGTTTASHAVTASSVVIIQRPVVVGTVAGAPSGPASAFTLTAFKDTTWTVTLAASTTYSERGVTSPTYANVAVGDEVVVYGTATGSHAATATQVVILQVAPEHTSPPHLTPSSAPPDAANLTPPKLDPSSAGAGDRGGFSILGGRTFPLGSGSGRFQQQSGQGSGAELQSATSHLDGTGHPSGGGVWSGSH